MMHPIERLPAGESFVPDAGDYHPTLALVFFDITQWMTFGGFPADFPHRRVEILIKSLGHLQPDGGLQGMVFWCCCTQKNRLMQSDANHWDGETPVRPENIMDVGPHCAKSR